jgi:HlyD family secretion protein
LKLFSKKKVDTNEIKSKGIVTKKFLTKKKVISAICIVLIGALGFGVYKYKFSKPKVTQTSAKYTALKKTKVATTINSSGAIKSGDSTNIYSNLEYNVASINVAVGDVVKKGDVLATIDTSTLQEQISEAEQTYNSNQIKNKNALASAKQKYENFKYLYDNNLDTSILNAEKAVDTAKLDLEDKTKTYEYDKAMLENGAVSQDTVNKAKIAVDNAESTYEKATVALEAAKVTEKQTLNEDKTAVDNAQAAVDDKTSLLQLEDKKKKLQDAQVVATVDGTVTNVNAVVGIQAAGALFVIQNLNDLIVNGSVDETDVANVKVGQKAEITTDASGSDIIEAEVVSVEPVSSTASASTSSTSTSGGKTSTSTSSTGNSTSSDVTFTVKIHLTGHNDKVKVGMNSVIKIITNEADDVYSVPYGAVVTKNKKSSVYAAIKQGSQYIVKEIPVTKGLESDTNVAIDGADLSEGMIILSEPGKYTVGSTVEINNSRG